MNLPFRLQLEKYPQPVTVVAFEGRERMNHPSRFDLEVLLSEDALALILATGAGLGAQLSVDEGSPEARRPAGLITAVRVVERLATGAVRARLRLESRWTRLARRRRSRIFLDASAAAMFEETFKHHGVPYRMAMVGDLRARSYTVQYREEDAALVRRMWGEEGLAAYVEDPPSDGKEEVLVIGDDPSMYTPMPGRVPLEVRDSPTPEEHQLTHVTLDLEATVRRFGLRGHDVRRPSEPRPSAATTDDAWHGGLGGEVDEYEADAQRGGPFLPERGD